MSSDLRAELESGVGGQYTIERELGGGGMSRVFVATDRVLGRRVVIKVLSSELAGDISLKRFEREIRLAASLQQANIVPLLSAGETDGRPHYTMPFVEGLSLRERLTCEPRPPLAETLGILRDVARALAYAHERGVVHRDIKPENVLLSGGAATVTDFGIAKALANARVESDRSEKRASTVTQAGTAVGSPAYMAPEQIAADPAIDHRADLYSYGCLAYELLAGEPPFGGRSVPALFSAHLSERPDPVGERYPECPPALARIVMRCLEKDPAGRPQSASEILAVLDGIATSATPLERFWQRRTRRQRIAGLTVALVAAAGAGSVQIRHRADAIARSQSLAVLPLANLSGDTSQDYFADGMTEALITDLGRVPGVERLIARGSVMRYKGTRRRLSEIANELGVRSIVTGALQKSGDRVRITVQLIDARTERQLWTAQYDRDRGEVLTLQDDVARGVAGQIRATTRTVRGLGKRTVNPDAHEAYLKGRSHWQRLSSQELVIAENYFQLALAKDSSYALAYSGIGTVWALRCNLGIVRCSDAIPKWKAAVQRALELDSSLTELQAQRAAIAFYADWDWLNAGRDLESAILSSPNDPVLRVWHAEYLQSVVGRMDEGLAEMRRGLALDPYNSTQQSWVGQAILATRRYDDAIRYLQQVLQTDPNAPLVRGHLQTALALEHRYSDAMDVLRRSMAASGNAEVAQAIERGYARGGYQGAMRERAELAERNAQRAYVPPTRVASFYASAGDRELAMDWLEKAYAEHEIQLVRLQATPTWDSLRDHPRFQALLRKMNFPRSR